MRLENNIINISDVKFAEKSEIKAGILYINRSELQEILQEDKRLGRVDIELAHPGESCRILQVADVVEPRAKISGGEDFPGALGRGTSGEGSTCVLRGTAVVLNTQSEMSGLHKNSLGDQIDMSGPAAEFTPYAKTHNVVLLPYPADGLSAETAEYMVAIKLAGLKAAVYLASAGKSIKPDEVEVYDIPSLVRVAKGMEDLPKVAYVFQIHCQSHPTLPGEPVLYGDDISRLTPTVIHPNEVLDGGIFPAYYASTLETYVVQNHPVIRELYRRHGKELCFIGVVVYTSKVLEHERERNTAMSTNLIRSILGADTAVFTYVVGGAPEIDMAQIAKECEDHGIKTVLIMRGLPGGEYGEMYAGHMVQDLVDSVVNVGDWYEVVNLPSVDRVIGKNVALPEETPGSGIYRRYVCNIRGAIDQFGNGRRVSIPY